jgi:hypothetical protein
MLYICSHNGVTGVIRADEFDDNIRTKRSELNRWGWMGLEPLRPKFHYRSIFLFTDKTKPEVHQVIGGLGELRGLLSDCAVEYRDFELPPIQAHIRIEGEQYVGGSTDIQLPPSLAAVRGYLTSPKKPRFLLI